MTASAIVGRPREILASTRIKAACHVLPLFEFKGRCVMERSSLSGSREDTKQYRRNTHTSVLCRHKQRNSQYRHSIRTEATYVYHSYHPSSPYSIPHYPTAGVGSISWALILGRFPRSTGREPHLINNRGSPSSASHESIWTVSHGKMLACRQIYHAVS